MTPAQFKVGAFVKGRDWQGRKVKGRIVGGIHKAAPANRSTLEGVTIRTPAMRSIIDGSLIDKGEYVVCRLRDVTVVKEK
ncbi:hypothetical protein [Streptomyces sp. URMC 125]|uniref:hypothetical protein n=1 Tax=Streptomyces sp. URMC 125 TaxID=3423419 RepID=UPI003F1C8C45